MPSDTLTDKQCRWKADGLEVSVLYLNQRNEALQAENKRLREALEDISNYSTPIITGMQDIAQTALQDKE